MYKKIQLLSLVLCTISCVVAEPELLNKKRPSDYILRFLSASKTLVWGSDNWKDSLYRYQTHATKFNHDTVIAHYKTHIGSDAVTIETTLKENYAMIAKDDKEFNNMLGKDNDRKTIFDTSSECYVTTNIMGSNRLSRKIDYQKNFSCTSIVIKRAFEKLVRAPIKS